jgi:hypothetical protein
MTDDTMALRALLEKSPDADFQGDMFETCDMIRISGAHRRNRLCPVCFAALSHGSYGVATELEQTMS